MATWLDKLTNISLRLKTGDGKIYFPMWQNAQKEIGFNTESFEFAGIDGAYVERGTKKGNQFPVLFYFQGEDHLDTAEAFEKSSIDKRAWEITHPYYGKIKVQPVSLKFDNSNHNLTAVSGNLIETTDLAAPVGKISPINQIRIENESLTAALVANFGNTITVGATTPQNSLSFVVLANNLYRNLPTSETIETYQNMVREAVGAANSIINDANRYMQSIANLYNFPILAGQNVEFRTRTIYESFVSTLNYVAGKNDTETAKIFESTGAAMVGAICYNSLFEPEYTSRAKCLKTKDNIYSLYESYMVYFDAVGLDISPETAQKLDYMVNLTAANLFEISFNLKQERTMVTRYPTNMLLLAHELFSGETVDSKIDAFLAANPTKRENYLQIPENTEILYYV